MLAHVTKLVEQDLAFFFGQTHAQHPASHEPALDAGWTMSHENRAGLVRWRLETAPELPRQVSRNVRTHGSRQRPVSGLEVKHERHRMPVARGDSSRRSKPLVSRIDRRQSLG